MRMTASRMNETQLWTSMPTCCIVLCCAVVCVQDRDLAGRGTGGLSCYFFNTFFLAKLYVHEGKYNYKNVSGNVRVG